MMNRMRIPYSVEASATVEIKSANDRLSIMSFPVTFEVILRISSIGTEVFLLMDDAEHVPLIDDSGLKVRDDKENVVDVKV